MYGYGSAKAQLSSWSRRAPRAALAVPVVRWRCGESERTAHRQCVGTARQRRVTGGAAGRAASGVPSRPVVTGRVTVTSRVTRVSSRLVSSLAELHRFIKPYGDPTLYSVCRRWSALGSALTAQRSEMFGPVLLSIHMCAAAGSPRRTARLWHVASRAIHGMEHAVRRCTQSRVRIPRGAEERADVTEVSAQQHTAQGTRRSHGRSPAQRARIPTRNSYRSRPKPA